MSTPLDAIEEALEWAGLEDSQAAEWAPTVVGCLRAHGFVIVPAEPTNDMIVAGVHHENMGDMAGRWRAMVGVALQKTEQK